MPDRGRVAPTPDACAATRQLIEALLARGLMAGPEPARIIETHISWVILTGEFAYKVKKPVNLGFVDFSTLESRHAACLEELRLNRRLTPALYCGLLAIRGTAREPLLDGDTPVIEYAVKMREFPARAVLSGEAARSIADEELESLATLIAGFHAGLAASASRQQYGSPQQILAPVTASLEQLDPLLQDPQDRQLLDETRRFLHGEFARHAALMQQRQASGCIRECHGDLHLGNLVRLGGRIVPFDALEFDPALRWIDVLSEIAFLVMDLELNGRDHAGFRFLNHYLDLSGDHAGLPVLPFYLSYRALVRAKVTALGPGAGQAATAGRVSTLLRYAANPLQNLPRRLILMAGISGSGKSHLARQIAAALPAIHLRSDIERKRLFGLRAMERTAADPDAGIYAPDASARTYAHLASLAKAVLEAGLPVIVDATHLSRAVRAPLLALARETGVISVLLVCRCELPIIARRIELRAAGGRDPSEAGLTVASRQIAHFEPPAADEADLVVEIDTGVEPPTEGVRVFIFPSGLRIPAGNWSAAGPIPVRSLIELLTLPA